MVASAGRGLFVNPIFPQTQVAHIYCYIFISVGARNFVMVLFPPRLIECWFHFCTSILPVRDTYF